MNASSIFNQIMMIAPCKKLFNKIKKNNQICMHLHKHKFWPYCDIVPIICKIILCIYYKFYSKTCLQPGCILNVPCTAYKIMYSNFCKIQYYYVYFSASITCFGVLFYQASWNSIVVGSPRSFESYNQA